MDSDLARTKYHRDYYYKTKDKVKYRYYEKKERKLEATRIYEPYGGEKAYYKMKMLQFCNKQ